MLIKSKREHKKEYSQEKQDDDESQSIQSDIFNAILDENILRLKNCFVKFSDNLVLQVLLTFSYPNTDNLFTIDPEALLDANELLGTSTNDLNALHMAIFTGEEDMVLEILNYVVEQSSHTNSKKVLYEFISKVWGDNNTVLHLASFMGMADLVKKLLDSGANVNKKNDNDYKAVDCADNDETRALFLNLNEIERGIILCDHKEIIDNENTKLKIKNVIKDNFSKSDTPLNKSNIKINMNKMKSTRRVVFDPRTLILEYAKDGDLENLKLLLEREYIFYEEIVEKETLNSIYDICVVQSRTTLLHFAAGYNYISLCKYLINKGAWIYAADIEGSTPIHFASMRGNVEILKLFLDIPDINLDVEDKDGETPLDVALDDNVKSLLKNKIKQAYKYIPDFNQQPFDLSNLTNQLTNI